jgi:hypothetical protein
MISVCRRGVDISTAGMGPSVRLAAFHGLTARAGLSWGHIT